MSKYPYGVYYDESNVRHEVHVHELVHVEVRARLRRYKVLTPDEEHQLFPRSGNGNRAAHYFCMAENVKKCLPREERDQRHKDRISLVIKQLKSNQEFLVRSRRFDNGFPDEEKYLELIRLEDYTWRTEVPRVVSPEAYFVPDVLGQQRSLRLTDRAPLVMIETINQHFPDDHKFRSVKEFTRLQPCLVMFDFCESPNWLFQIKLDEQTIRTTYYMYDGDFWINGERKKTYNADLFKEDALKRLRENAAKRQMFNPNPVLG